MKKWQRKNLMIVLRNPRKRQLKKILSWQSGNKLTQTIDEDGNLIGVNNMDFSDREIVDPDTPPPAK